MSAEVTLHVQSVGLSSRFGTIYGERHSGKWTFSFKATWARAPIVLATGEDPAELPIFVSLSETSTETVDWASDRMKEYLEEGERACGLLRYNPALRFALGGGAAADLLFEVWAPPEIINSLVGFAQHGRHITRLGLDIQGVEFGDLDGNIIKWHNSEEKCLLPIINADFSISISDKA